MDHMDPGISWMCQLLALKLTRLRRWLGRENKATPTKIPWFIIIFPSFFHVLTHQNAEFQISYWCVLRRVAGWVGGGCWDDYATSDEMDHSISPSFPLTLFITHLQPGLPSNIRWEPKVLSNSWGKWRPSTATLLHCRCCGICHL